MAKDPCEITGSWDAVFCLPTDAAVGALVTGEGNAWSMPHSSNLLGTEGWMSNGYYGGGDAALSFNGTTTSVNAGSNATIDDIPAADYTFEAWIRLDSRGQADSSRVLTKGSMDMFCRDGHIYEADEASTGIESLVTFPANVAL